MKKKVVWSVVTGWMVAALLLASCAPTAVKEEEKVAPPKEKEEVVVPKEVVVTKEETNLIKWTGTKLDGTVVEKMIEKPRYGGVHITPRTEQPTGWDDILENRGFTYHNPPVMESLLLTDWASGPAGTEEWLDTVAYEPGRSLMSNLAESWERPDDSTLIYHIRKGVRFALDPTSEASRLVGGRELTAADIVKASVRAWTIGYYTRNYPYLSDMKNPANSIYVSPDDPWAVVFKSSPGGIGLLFRHAAHGRNLITASEVIEKYGAIKDWRHVVGTGPFILKEYVGASSLTYVKNPNYWGHDPFFPENQLPYLDGFKILIIPDLSTQQAALRTGKVDYLTLDITKEDAEQLRKTNPELGSVRLLPGGGGGIFMRLDKPELPWSNVKVRRALSMAINFQELKDQYWDGDAELLTYPVAPKAESMDVYIPLEKMPESTQELFGYHPDKAKQLLVEAGYPQGFKAEIITEPQYVDMLSVIKEYWAKIGVDLKMDVRDFAVFASIRTRKTHTQMLMDAGTTYYITLWASTVRPGGGSNYSMVNDPWMEKMYSKLIDNYFDPEKKRAIQVEPMAEGIPSWAVYANEQVWFINLPQPYTYRLWQPWLKGHSGVLATGFSVDYGYTKYAWIDQELKKAMER